MPPEWRSWRSHWVNRVKYWMTCRFGNGVALPLMREMKLQSGSLIFLANQVALSVSITVLFNSVHLNWNFAYANAIKLFRYLPLFLSSFCILHEFKSVKSHIKFHISFQGVTHTINLFTKVENWLNLHIYAKVVPNYVKYFGQDWFIYKL